MELLIKTIITRAFNFTKSLIFVFNISPIKTLS